ncbi:uncharacterized protein BJ212DRAFT_756594 [Suillus subaureus]|uniref:Uncharacterized protein n=1 Tax=Suillus subaureus TaxID=48587 RepID=A0A9P7J833_9AGAM|nr:uncharacterized protein BJ212DRAFT_756594 [Suillus subaureus]KAG1807279.1 hypothetical protein BJ212DRAFT_756594 [Suillus subaureus]
MGVPPAAEQPSYPSAPPLAQPSYNQHLEQVPEQRVPEQQAPEKPASVAAAEESVVKRGKRKAVDLDDDDAPPQKKQMVHALLYHPDFELVESNGEARYKCCLPQCENVAAVRQAGIQGHIRSKRHQKAGVRFQSPVCNEAVSRMDPSNISRSCSKNQQEANEVSQRPCEGPTSSQPFEYFSNNFEETTDFTPGEPLQEPVNSLDKTVDSAWDEQVNEFFSIINKAAESTSGEQLEEAVNNFEGTADSASGEQLAFVNSLDKTDDSVPDDLFEYCMNNLDKMYYSAPAPGESLDDLLNRLLSSQAS